MTPRDLDQHNRDAAASANERDEPFEDDDEDEGHAGSPGDIDVDLSDDHLVRGRRGDDDALLRLHEQSPFDRRFPFTPTTQFVNRLTVDEPTPAPCVLCGHVFGKLDEFELTGEKDDELVTDEELAAAVARHRHAVVAGALFDFIGYLTSAQPHADRDGTPLPGANEASRRNRFQHAPIPTILVNTLSDWAETRKLQLDDALVTDVNHWRNAIGEMPPKRPNRDSGLMTESSGGPSGSGFTQ